MDKSKIYEFCSAQVKLFVRCRGIVLNDCDYDDLVQNLCLYFLTHEDVLKNDLPLLKRCAKFRIIDILRLTTKCRYKTKIIEGVDLSKTKAPVSKGFIIDGETVEAEIVQTALNSYPIKRYKHIILDMFYNGLSGKECAEKYGYSIGRISQFFIKFKEKCVELQGLRKG